MGYVVITFIVLSLVLIIWAVIDLWKQTNKY